MISDEAEASVARAKEAEEAMAAAEEGLRHARAR